METIVKFFDSYGLDFWSLAKTGAVLLLGSLLISLFSRFVFGKKSILNNAVSSAIGILFLYALTVVLYSAGTKYQPFIAPLPFVTISEDTLILSPIKDVHYTVLCAELLSMIILSFLVNIVDGWLPKKKNVFSWLFFRCLTVLIALALHLLVTWLFTTYLPEGIVTYAPPILLILLALMLLTGSLKIVVGVLLSTVNPLIAALYTFFFANMVGKQITKAVLTTALLTGFVYFLEYLGIFSLSIAVAALMAYVPFLLILTDLWYIACQIL
jgi:hypothetical protein